MHGIVRGVPTEPDVAALCKAYPVDSLTEGRIIEHDGIESVINKFGDATRASCRYKTVVEKWRRDMERIHNIRIGAEKGKGYRVLAPGERLMEAEDHTKKSIRQAKRAHYRSSAIDTRRLDEHEQRRQQHIQTTSATIVAHARLLADSTKHRPIA